MILESLVDRPALLHMFKDQKVTRQDTMESGKEAKGSSKRSYSITSKIVHARNNRRRAFTVEGDDVVLSFNELKKQCSSMVYT